MVEVKAIVDMVIDSVTVDGNIDFDAFKEVIDELRKAKKQKMEENAKALKEAREAKAAEDEILNKEWAEQNLSEGMRIRYTAGSGKKAHIVEATVGKQKDGAKRLHVLLDNGQYDPNGKADRYVPYSKIIPELVAVEVSENEIEEDFNEEID